MFLIKGGMKKNVLFEATLNFVEVCRDEFKALNSPPLGSRCARLSSNYYTTVFGYNADS